MNDDTLATLLRRSVDDVQADRDVVDRAWARARRKSRRDQLIAVGLAGLAAALVVVLVSVPRDDGRSAPPITTPTSADRSVEPTLAQSRADYLAMWEGLSQPAWTDDRVDELPYLATKLPHAIDAFDAPAPSLSDAPVPDALAVAQAWGPPLDVRVLGEDGQWRVVDTTGVTADVSDGSIASVIGGRPLSPGGTQLALAQRGSVVLVDLTTADRRRIELPQDDLPVWARRATQWSPDGSQVLVGAEQDVGPDQSWLVDVATGQVEAVPYRESVSAFAPDGTLYELGTAIAGCCEIRRYDPNAGAEPSAVAQLQADLYSVRPAVDDVAAVARAVRGWVGPKSLVANSDGLLVVDPRSGELVAFMPMRELHRVEVADLVGWLDGETLLFSVFDPGETGREVLVAWDYRTSTVSLVSAWRDGDFHIAFAPARLR